MLEITSPLRPAWSTSAAALQSVASIQSPALSTSFASAGSSPPTSVGSNQAAWLCSKVLKAARSMAPSQVMLQPFHFWLLWWFAGFELSITVRASIAFGQRITASLRATKPLSPWPLSRQIIGSGWSAGVLGLAAIARQGPSSSVVEVKPISTACAINRREFAVQQEAW